MIIYHYTKAKWGSVILRDQCIKVSSAHTLNDPFELSPVVDPKFYQNAAPLILRTPDGIRTSFEVYGKEWGYRDIRVFELDASNWIPKIIENIPKNVANAQAQFAETFSQRFRLFFASKVPDSILMWSHYAEQHSGVVFEFDTRFFPFVELDPIEVKYRAEKAGFEALKDIEGSYESAMRGVIETKAPAWAYEQEVRFRFPVTASQNDLVRFDPRCVRGVLFGCRTTTETRTAVLTELDASRYAHVAVAEFKRSADKFALERYVITGK